MYPLLETVCIKDGHILNFQWHQMRYCRSIYRYYRRTALYPLFANISIPQNSGLYKLRILYNLKHKIWQFSAYSYQQNYKLKLIEANNLCYSLKYSDRRSIDELYLQRGICDDILITKQGLITDTSRHNILFFNAHSWYTPSAPLLVGTTLERLIYQRQIIPTTIRFQHISTLYTHFKLINCMQDFSIAPCIPVNNIY